VRLALVHARTNTVDLIRQPAFWVPSVAFPVLFFVLFGISAADQFADRVPAEAGVGAEVVLTQFLLFGVLGIMFFQFGVGIAEDRRLPWDRTLRILPSGGLPRFAGRVLTALAFSVLAMVPALVVGLLATELRVTGTEWVLWFVTIFAGAVPFGLMGIALGYAATVKAALPIANIGFLLMSFLGDLFVPVEQLPPWVAASTPFMPTYHWKEFVLGTIDPRQTVGDWAPFGLYLLGWTVAFAVIAVAVYRRDEGARYR
jgi:ABC-2 type transport system permease protein